MTHSNDEYETEDRESEECEKLLDQVQQDTAKAHTQISSDDESHMEDREPEGYDKSDNTSINLPDPSPMLARVQQHTAKARSQMSIKYSKTQDIAHFEVGELASVYIPRNDRHGTSARRLFCKIIQKPHPDR